MPQSRTARLTTVLALAGLALTAGASASRFTAAGSRQVERDTGLVITGGTVVTMDARNRVLTPGAVAVAGSVITAVGSPDDVRRAHPGARVLDASGAIVLPGLINTHTHAPMVMYRGLADDLALADWLQQYIFPAEAGTVSPAFVRTGTRLAALEMIRSGTTTYADMYYFEEEIARETRAAGLRGILGQTIVGFPAPDAKTPAEALARARAFIDEFAGDPLIVPAVAPHSMYLLDREALLAARDLATSRNVPLLIHVAETRGEVETAREKHRATPIGFLDAIGFWAPITVAAHGVWATADDIRILAGRKVGVSHNPESNMKLASGTAPVPEYLKAGVRLSLGTDGAASNNDLDMFEAMRQAALLHKLSSGDPRAVPARMALEMATIGGARVLGLHHLIGSLEPGKRADLIVVGMRKARHTPLYDPISHLVYVARGDDVETTIVNGRVLMEGGGMRSMDEAAVLEEARRLSADVVRAVRAAAP